MKEYESLQAYLEEQKRLESGAESSVQIQQEPLREEESIKEFMALMKDHGLDQEVQQLDALLTSLEGIESQFSAMRARIVTLQEEVEQLTGDTPLTAQFKKEMTNRSINLWQRLDHLSAHALETKDAILSAARDSIHDFMEKGRAALHRACAFMYNAGIRFYKNSLETHQARRDTSQDILGRLDELDEATKSVRHQRGNLARVLFGRDPKASINPKDSLLLNTIRKIAETDLETANKGIHKTTQILSKLEDHRNHHLTAADRKASVEDLLKDAQSRAKRQEHHHKNKSNDRGPTNTHVLG